MSNSTLRFLIQGFHHWQQILPGGNLGYRADNRDRLAEKFTEMAVSTELPSGEQSGRRYRRRVAVST